MSDIKSLFQQINVNLSSSDLIPIKVLKDPKQRKIVEKELKKEFPPYEYFQEALDYLGMEDEHFYIAKKGLYPYYYYNEYLLIDILSFEKGVLEFMDLKNKIKHTNNFMQKCIEEKEFHKLFTMLDQKILFSTFEKIHHLIPKEQKMSIFIDIYIRANYGFSELNTELIREIFTYKTELSTEEIDNLENYADKDGIVEIYRGEGEKSTPYTQSFSWTADLNTAIFFASRFDLNGRVYKAKVSLNDIIAFIDRRSEEEILVLPENVFDVEKLALYTTNEIMKEIENSNLLLTYYRWVSNMEPELFHNSNGIHGVLHCKRVLLHTIILGMLEKLNENEMYILNYCATYHDIGRTHDEEDDTHGYNSIKKAKKEGLFKDLEDENNEIIKFIIENHCISDDNAKINLANYKMEDKEKAWYLFLLFKDADGLDRVRLRDLDIKYLRNENAKNLVIVANGLLQGLK